jgi:cytidine deaminase
MELAPSVTLRLVTSARRARRNAYAPFSGFSVGAAALAEDGSVHLGCNVESSSFGLTVCAERNAIAAVIVAGARPVAIAVVTPGGEPPCGACRQVLAELNPEMTVIVATPEGTGWHTTSIETLLPEAFRLPR